MRPVSSCAALVGLAISCAPSVDGVAERQRAVDTEDGARLAAQLAALPGVVTAQASVHRGVTDPLQPGSAAALGNAAILVVIDDHAERAQTLAAARALVRGVAPEIAEPEIVVALSDPRPALARVGPFEVVASSRRPLILTLALALAAIAALALALASYARRGSRAQ